MSYVSKSGRRPFEYASKSSHSEIINDPDVQNFLEKCNLPKSAEEIKIDNRYLITLGDTENPVEYVVAVDGGNTTASVRKTFPSACLGYFQFGANFFSIEDLISIHNKPFILPEDMGKLKNLEKIKLVLPIKGITTGEETSITKSVRKAIFEFFSKERDGSKYIHTLKWFLFYDYEETPLSSYILSKCPYPNCTAPNIQIQADEIGKDYSLSCPVCNNEIYLTDVFRLHEAIDEELGASGIMGYVTNLVEQFIIIHSLREILRIQPGLLGKILFIKDGPLGFFGQTANMYKPMRNLLNYLAKTQNVLLAGLEKSGAFVEHADEIKEKLKPGDCLLLSNKYIYSFILPGNPNTEAPYGQTSLFACKLIFKSFDNKIYVVSIPSPAQDTVLDPGKENFPNLDIVLKNIQNLKCDMYDNALFPIALANKLVSLSDHPSSTLLERFSQKMIK